MNQGPEDSPGWRDVSPEADVYVVLTCRSCGKEIQFWHCAESGCPWCASCGANAKPTPKEK